MENFGEAELAEDMRQTLQSACQVNQFKIIRVFTYDISGNTIRGLILTMSQDSKHVS